jgi:hypothetical protein
LTKKLKSEQIAHKNEKKLKENQKEKNKEGAKMKYENKKVRRN